MATPALGAAPARARTAVLASAGFFIATLLLTRQSQVPAIAGLAAPWALLLVVWRLRLQPGSLLLLPMTVYAMASAIVSMMAGHEPLGAVRFLLITVGTLLAFQIRPAVVSVPWALLPVALQGIGIAAVSIFMALSQDPELALLARAFVQEQEWGDIYSFDGLYYRVQLVGNALLPLLFMVSVWRYGSSRTYRVLALLSFVGLLAAGNLTYFVAMALAVALRWRSRLFRTLGRASLAGLLLAAVVALASSAINEAFSTKFEGSDSSMGVRFDQIDAAYRHVSDSPLRLAFGVGLGAAFPDGRERRYSQSQYIELQSLYLFLQLGVIGSLLYLVTLYFSSRLFLDADGRTIFWLFMLAGSTNPYILDTNQIVATALLVCLFPRADRRRRQRHRVHLQSGQRPSQ